MNKSYITAGAILLLVILWIASGVLFPSQEQHESQVTVDTPALGQEEQAVSIYRITSRPYRGKFQSGDTRRHCDR